MRMHALPPHLPCLHPQCRGLVRGQRWSRDRPAGGWHLGDARPGRPRHSTSPSWRLTRGLPRLPDQLPAWFRGRPGWPGAVAATAAAVLVAACSGGSAMVRLPAKPDAATAPVHAVRATQARPRQQVVAAYTSYNNAVQQAQNTRNTVQVKAIMAKYVPASSIQAYVTAFRQEWAHGEIGYGGSVSHILHVRLIGRSEAVIDDCLNTTHSGLEYVRTGTVVPGTVGTGHDNLATTLVRRHGRWLVATQTPVEVPCAY